VVSPVGVGRVAETAWILHPIEGLEGGTVEALRDAFLEVVDAGALHVLVDLSSVDTVAPSGAETLLAMADLMRGRQATLWLAARRGDGDAYALRAIDGRRDGTLLGLSPALDAALERLQAENGHRDA